MKLFSTMINLSNYEEYFLLYIDNELSREACEAVEAFVREHPHLAAELEILQDTKLPPADAVIFDDKTTLYKATDNCININNHEEYFLLHTDKELSATQEAEVEQFVLQHPQYQEEFLLLQKARLTPEVIECPDKHRLYKQPGKRVVPLYITRMAVAAAVAGVVVLAGNFLLNGKGNHTQVAVKTPQHKAVEQTATPGKQTTVDLPEERQKDVAVTKNETKKQVQAPVKASKVVNTKPLQPDNKQVNDYEPVVAHIDPLPAIQQTIPTPDNMIASNNATPKQEHTTVLKPLEEVNEDKYASTVMYVSNNDASAKPAVYKELNTDEDDQTLYIGALQLNKAKVNGLFKKATHLLGGKNKESNL